MYKAANIEMNQNNFLIIVFHVPTMHPQPFVTDVHAILYLFPPTVYIRFRLNATHYFLSSA